mmetsp:Transcript_15402/g.30413  ORF Transcript_15402/g.30413 Transcript_15402/m.30413 type:complete len:223 (-) Transcript_15402:52-720(-)|eukprot:CAMPEP_0173392452 /NCGR_PEP_ID=MMETSP1356-20130122/19654_1 /TAXON_ID=77927 ORGANISM="Hemiselmis virescens, Strain PCC157" /NCGR_SAMPLE_ID=MMETSP1356 /ASSEMBLY_ACC=CAM_ASM_000847 /LENGTH=222 /DNA_ID=CAMNT_0014350249 /DNA_START=90 /DNA_END=758 /DNA_ORIENTATION=-
MLSTSLFMFTPLAYLSGYLVLIFMAVCMACGLYYLAELAEEYSRLTKRAIKYSIISIAVIHVLLLLFDGFPWFTTLFGLGLHGVYFQFLKTYPFVDFGSPMFLGSCAGLVLNHYLWIVFFRDAYQYRVPQIMAFFVPCVWLVPFLYFVSVSLGDNVLPSATHSGGLTGGVQSSSEGGGGKSSAAKALMTWAMNKRDQLMGMTGMAPKRDSFGGFGGSKDRSL